MTTTINVAFDPTSLPKWAQRIPAVVARCKTDLSYRCNVCAATTPAMRNVLKREAK